MPEVLIAVINTPDTAETVRIYTSPQFTGTNANDAHVAAPAARELQFLLAMSCDASLLRCIGVALYRLDRREAMGSRLRSNPVVRWPGWMRHVCVGLCSS